MPCIAGTASYALSNVCRSCSVGQYSPAKSRNCESCRPSYYSSNPAQPCAKCPPGQYSGPKASRCLYCDPGSAVNSSQTGCKRIRQTPAPTRKPTWEPTSPPVAFYCGPGTYPNMLTGTCWQCPFGSQSPGGLARCKRCPVMYRPTESRKGCEAYGPLTCKAGYWGPGGPGTWNYPCVKCPTGTYRPPNSRGFEGQRCKKCEKGYVPNADQSGCELSLTPAPTLQPTFELPPLHYDCAPGYYDTRNSTLGCLKCPPGTISQGFTTKCEECPGRYTNEERTKCASRPETSPTPAPIWEPTSPPVPLYCGPGTYPNTLIGTCSPCPPLSYSSGGLAECMFCRSNYRPREDQTGCEEYGPLTCKAGYYGPGGLGSWSYPCVNCPTGTYRSAADPSTQQCNKCSDGYMPNADQSGCELSLTPAPTLQPTLYQPIHYDCLPGYYDSRLEGVGCLKCPPGTVSEDFTTKCELCREGFIPNAGQTKCVSTPEPTPEPTPAPARQPTPQPTYGRTPAPSLIKYCGPGLHPEYVKDRWACMKCPPGLMSPGGLKECTKCPKGNRPTEDRSKCENLGPLTCKAGYYGKKKDGIYEYPCDKCPPRTYSTGGCGATCNTCPGASYVNANQTGCIFIDESRTSSVQEREGRVA